MILEPRIEFKSIEADTLLTDGHLDEVWADLGVMQRLAWKGSGGLEPAQWHRPFEEVLA